MPLVKSYDEVENPRIERSLPNGHFAWRTDFIRRPEDKSVDTPMAFLAEGTPNRVLRAHFHQVDQFQVIYNGSGSMGKHPVSPGAVHFSRAYTPYGPISYSADKGLGFLTLRAHRDPGASTSPKPGKCWTRCRTARRGRSPRCPTSTSTPASTASR